MNLKNYIYNHVKSLNENQVKFLLGLLSSILVLALFYLSSEAKPEASQIEKESQINLTLMIPDGYVLFGFEAENYEQISPLLGPYSMAKVYSPQNGRLLALNIKVLRAPKDPSQLSFLVPVNIANYFARFGLEYRTVLQKYEEKRKPTLIQAVQKKSKTSITYGESKYENS